MISIILVVIMLFCGVLCLVLPEDKLVNKDKLKPDQSFEEAVKSNRKYGIIMIGIAIVFFFINVL